MKEYKNNQPQMTTDQSDNLRSSGLSLESSGQFTHNSFEDRLNAYNNQISTCDFDWGAPKGKEML